MASNVDKLTVRPASGEGAHGTFERSVSLILIATPALFALLTFQPMSEFGMVSLRLSLPVRFAEVLIVIFAIRDGFSISEAWRGLARWTKLWSGLWMASVITAAVFANRDPALAIGLAAGTLLHGIVALALYDRLRRLPAEAAVMLLRSAAIGLAGYALAAVFCQALVSGRSDFPWVFFGAGVTNVRQIGFFGIPLVGIALGLMALARNQHDRRTYVALLLAGLFLVIWCGGRASVLGAGAAVAVAVWFAKGRRKRLVAATALCTGVAAPLAHLLSRSAEYGPVSLLRFLSHENSAPGIDGYSSSRIQFWEWTWEDIASQPLIGHGEGQFAWMIYDRIGNVYNHPHNFVLQVMYEWGIPGFLALAVMLAGTLLRATRLRGEKLAYAVPALSGLTGLATTSLLDGSLYYPMPLLCAFLFLAVIERQSAAMESAPSR